MQSEREQTEAMKQEPPIDGDARRRERIRMDQAVQRNLAEREAQRAAPRLRARAAAEDAKSRVPEAMGYHEPMSPIRVLGQARNTIELVCNSVAGTFDAISAALANPALDDPGAVLKVAELGRDAIESHAASISEMRGQLLTAKAHAYTRAQKATTPPTALTAVVSDARAALRGMDDEERGDLMASAKGHDREVLMYAIGGAPGFVTKSHDAKRTEFRNEIIGINDSELLELEPGIPTMLAALDKTEAGMRRLIGMVVDFQSADALRKLRG